MLQGAEVIKSHLQDAPTLPGVYQMLSAAKKVIYVGKAKNLKNRLTSYAQNDLVGKTARMVEQTAYLEYTVTSSETAALLLEAQLIKKFQPKFNILLKDDKSFPYIKLRLDHPYPQLLKYRGKNLTGGEFFGPFASVQQVDVTLSELQKIFKLRPCSDNYFDARKRPCLQYQIGRCFAPCVNKISQPEYSELVAQVKAFLLGKTQDLQQELSRKMEEYSNAMRFEEAAELRDRIKALSYIQINSGLMNNSISDADFIAIIGTGDSYCIEVFLYRAGSACGNVAYFPAHTEGASISAVLESFMLQFYQTRTPPKDIFMNCKLGQTQLVIDAIQQLHGVKFNITYPTRGDKLKLLENAEVNARLALRKHLENTVKNQAVFLQIQELFSLRALPERIEVYDNSHIMGEFAVGAMVVATPDGFDKKEYRVVNIKSTKLGDDYAMLKEVLTRRFARLQKEPSTAPDLMIIDGGKSHMSVVIKAMQEFGINLPFVCMSKGPLRNAGLEQFHMLGRDTFTLDKNQPMMKYLQILRDEAHNTAIDKHRTKRSRAIKSSSLDDIAGIGAKRKKALLNHFGSMQAIKEASIEQLIKVQGINRAVAEAIVKTASQ